MNRRDFVAAALAAAAGGPAAIAGAAPLSSAGLPRAAQAVAGVTGVDYFPVYYAWYAAPNRWDDNPDYLPELGRYQSDQAGLINQHLGWLQDNGGAGFTINWRGPQAFDGQVVDNLFVPQIASFPGLEFCIHYDPYIRWGLPMPDFTTDQAARATWRSDARYIARNHMPHPQHARVGNRPVLFVYLSRAIEGLDNLEAFVDIARQEVAAAGHAGVYLVLGEVWWIPTPAEETAENIAIIKSVRAPRTRLGDAMYSYNLATEPVHDRIWRGNIRTFLGEAGRVYKDYRNLMDRSGAAGKHLVTTLMPRFDNTVLRIAEGGPPGMNIGPWRGYGGVDYAQDIAAVFRKLGTSFEPVRGDRTIAVVTSWNEWPERSALEPSRAGTDKDGLAAPQRAYLTALGREVESFGRPPDPVFRASGGQSSGAGAGGTVPDAPRGLDGRRLRAEERLAEIDAALDFARLSAARTEKVTLRDVSAGRVLYRRQMEAGAR